MAVRHRLVTGLALALVSSVLYAQAQAPLSPAPTLGPDKDKDGRPVPFGVPKYEKPDTPLGSGPYPAIMTTDPSAPDHVIYRPAKLPACWPVQIWPSTAGVCR